MVGAKPITWRTDEVYVGIDPSLTATGVAVIHKGQCKTFLLATKEKGLARLAWFRREFASIFETYTPNRLAIEGYAYASKFSHAHGLGELGGVLRLAAHDCRLPTIIVPPNNLKMFATGKGQAAKGVIIKEAFRRWGIDVDDDNEADAAVLAIMASAHSSGLLLTSFQESAMKKVERMA